MDDPLRNKLLALLPLDDLKSITERSSVVGFAQGNVVQKEGQEVTAIHFPLSGMLSLLVVLKGGRTAETSVVGREGMIGADHNGVVCTENPIRVDDVMESPKLAE